MPYIKQSDRKILGEAIKRIIKLILDPVQFGTRAKAGVLNYLFTVILKSVLDDDKRYDTANSLIGALECCKLELYRRYIAPYEDEKILENGDVDDFFNDDVQLKEQK